MNESRSSAGFPSEALRLISEAREQLELAQEFDSVSPARSRIRRAERALDELLRKASAEIDHAEIEDQIKRRCPSAAQG